jgi:hypothetical protein
MMLRCLNGISQLKRYPEVDPEGDKKEVMEIFPAVEKIVTKYP